MLRCVVEAKKSTKRLLLLNSLFDKQRLFIGDPSKRKAAICGRRSGKTTGVGPYLVATLLDDVEADCAYIGLTRNSAKRLLFNKVINLDKKYDLGLHIDRTELTFTTKGGNTLYICGAHTEDETEKLRGLKFKLVVLDECASFKAHLNYMIEEVLEPTLVDTDGTMCMIGTPSANPGDSYFYQATARAEHGFSVHHWTILDNPYIPHAKRWLDDYKFRKGWTEDNPVYQREWLGKWTTDSSSLVYKYDRAKQDYSSMERVKWHHVMGVDIGTVDYFALHIWAYSYDSPNLYSVYQFKRSGWYTDEWVHKIKEVMEIYNPISIVADHGGLGKAICMDIRRRYGIPLEPAEKSQKWAAIEQLNSDMHTGRVKIKYGSELQKEMVMLQRDPDRQDKEDSRTANDLCDAALYSYRKAYHYLGNEPNPVLEPYTEQWAKQEAIRLEKLEMENFEREQREKQDLLSNLV